MQDAVDPARALQRNNGDRVSSTTVQPPTAAIPTIENSQHDSNAGMLRDDACSVELLVAAVVPLAL